MVEFLREDRKILFQNHFLNYEENVAKIFDRNKLFLLGLLAAAAFCISYYSPVSYAHADPAGTLLTAQSLVQNGTLRLDTYRGWIPNNPAYVEVRNHIYWLYPVGTPLFITPFVWTAGLTGEVFLPNTQADSALQNFISGLTVAACALLMYFLLAAICSPLHSYLLAAVFTFGTAIMSTLGTGLWSINLAMLFSLAALILLVYEAVGRHRSLNSYLLGFLLFSAYLCRPSEVLFVGFVFLYVLVYRRPVFLRLLLFTLSLLAVFIAYSFLELRQVLPEYYRSSAFELTWNFFPVLIANLFSPSRGLLVFSPFLALVLAGSLVFIKSLWKNPIFQLSGAWVLAHVAMISAWKVWWGGDSFGPRLLSDALPALLLLLALVWQTAQKKLGTKSQRAWVVVFAVLAGVSIFIHSYQGMFNPATDLWNNGPAQSLLDWKYPQFLASPQQLAARKVDYDSRSLPVYPWGEAISVNSPYAVFDHWYEPETMDGENLRWSLGTASAIILRFDPGATDPAKNYRLKVRFGGIQEVKAKILFNGNEIGAALVGSPSPESFLMNLPGKWIRPGELNRLEFIIDPSNANLAAFDLKEDGRLRGISLMSLTIGE
jgi:hypothetical protein